MDATQEIRLKFIDLLQTTLEFSQVLQWEFHANHSFNLQILSQVSSDSEVSLIFCQQLIEREHQLLSQGKRVCSDSPSNSLSLNITHPFSREYSWLLIPCYYQSSYLGGFLFSPLHPHSVWTEAEILLIQKSVDQYACVQYWLNRPAENSIISFPQSSFDPSEILMETLNYHCEPEQALEKILILMGEYFKVGQIQLKSCFNNEDTIIQEWPGRENNITNSLLKIPIFLGSAMESELILQISHLNRIFTNNEIQSLEKIGQYISIIFQQIQLEKTLKELVNNNNILEAANQNKSEFLSHMNHELRTPLTGILGFSRMLQEEIYGPLNSKQKQYMQGIVASGEHLLALINDFLDISKIEANREELFLEMIAVEDICLSALSMLRNRAKEQGIQLNLELDPKVNMCTTDQRRLKQILLNLLSNAVKFTEVGSVTLKVDHYPNKLTFSVIDTGIGIKPSDQRQLFQPFQQIHSELSRKHKGTGLGLALSRKLAQLHGGDITLTSEAGKGSCFTLHLPFQCQL